MDWILPYLTFIYIALGLIVLSIVAYFILKFVRSGVRGRRGNRLSITEYYEIDKSRRLVLVRRDEIEHLLLIGGAQDLVIEASVSSPLISPAPQARPAPRPAVFGGRRPMLRPVDNNENNRDDEN
jgi:Flagellar biosynthesis protein, FliO